MRACLFLVLALLSLACPAVAQDMEPRFRQLMEEFQAHRRVAIGYLRTGNVDLAAVEIERLRESWRKGRGALSAEDASNMAVTRALDETESVLDASADAVDRGELDQARALLTNAARPLADWRASLGMRLFSDCIAEAGAAYELLDIHRTRPPDLTGTGIVEQITAAAVATQTALRRCDGEAPPDTRADPEFRRLIDGFLASLAQLPNALSRQDNGLLHRLLIEQRSFERLLAFRFG